MSMILILTRIILTLKNPYMETTEIKTKVLKSSEGKILRRISDGLIAGTEVYLGYTYYIGGVKLDEPKLEVPEDYEEIDIPEEYKEVTNG